MSPGNHLNVMDDTSENIEFKVGRDCAIRIQQHLLHDQPGDNVRIPQLIRFWPATAAQYAAS